MKVLVTGGSGFIGSALIKRLIQRGDQVVAWVHKKPIDHPQVRSIRTLSELDTADAVINLAGAPIADQRWSDARKRLIESSRLDTTRELVDWMAAQEHKPEVLISGSAIGFYGAVTREAPVTEDTLPLIQDFSSRLCRLWEEEALKAETLGVRVALLRTGIVLGAGGALAKMRLPFSLGLGGPIAGGRQAMPWIHLDDEVGAILHILDNQTLCGPFNLTAPNPVSNATFVKSLGQAMSRPAFLPMPALGARMMLGGEASALLTEGLSVVPQKLLNSGYKFEYTDLDAAMRSAVSAF